MITALGDKSPHIDSSVFVAPDAWVIGDVTIGQDSSVFFGSVLRGDLMPIRIGQRSNIQEHTIIHTTRGRSATIVGDEVTVGHRATLHGCTVGNRVLVGMGAILLDEAVIGEDCFIAAGALITEGKIIPPRSMVMGCPGKVVRTLSEEELKFLPRSAENYVQDAKRYLALFK